MLDLDAGVHLDEDVAPIGGHQELDGARVQVTHGPSELDAVRPQPLPNGAVEVGSRGDLNHFLVAALDRTVPLEKVHDVAGAVGQDLHLDVARPFDGRLEEDRRVAESGRRLARRRLYRGAQFVWACHPPEAPAAPAGGRLYEQGEADFGAGDHQVVDVVPRAGAGQDGDAGGLRLLLGGHLIAGQGQDPGRRPYERDPGLFARPGQLRVLGQETVTGVHGVGTTVLRHLDQARDIEVGAEGVAPFSYLVALVRLLAMQ